MAEASFDMVEIGPAVVGQEYGPDTVRGSDNFRIADRRCRAAQGVDVVGDTPEELAQEDAKAIGLTECVREHGWEMPDPTRDRVTGYLQPGSPVVPADADQADQLLSDLTECAASVGVAVFGDG